LPSRNALSTCPPPCRPASPFIDPRLDHLPTATSTASPLSPALLLVATLSRVMVGRLDDRQALGVRPKLFGLAFVDPSESGRRRQGFPSSATDGARTRTVQSGTHQVFARP